MKQPALRVVTTIIVAIVLLASASCQNQSGPAPTAPAAAAPAGQAAAVPTAAAPAGQATSAPPAAQAAAATTPEVIRLGISAALSGPAAAPGLAIDRFARMAVDDINAKGGVVVSGKTYRVEAITVDDKNSADTALDMANKLVLAEKANSVISGGSGGVAAAQILTERHNILLMGMTAADSALGTKHPLTFIMNPHQSLKIKALYERVARENPNAKRVAYVASDDAGGRNFEKLTQDEFAASGRFQLVASEFFKMDQVDFSPIITRLLRANPDVIDLGIAGRPTQTNAIVKSLYEQEFKGRFVASSSDLNVMRQSASLLEGYVTTTLVDWKTASLTPGAKDLINRYIQKYNEAELQVNVLNAFAIPSLITQAMVKAGSVTDGAKLAQSLRAGEWDTIYGKSTFGGAKLLGLPIVLNQPIYFSKIEKGQVVSAGGMDGILP